ncbi:MAG: LPS-assembly protein LptD [Myxococcota bacterium]
MVLVIGVLGAPPAAARDLDEVPFEITADSIEVDAVQRLYIAEGHVRIVQQEAGRSLSADWVVFSNETKRGAAAGNVLMEDEDERVRAQFALFDVDSLQGLVHDGEYRVVERDGTAIRLRAIELVKSGDTSYAFWKGVFTTCNCPDEDARDPWALRSSRGDIEVGGYGTAWNSTIEVLGIPAMWIPWIMFPVKSERETGILFPEFGVGNRRGVEFGLPVFFAIGDSLNLMLTPRWMSKRGYKQDALLEFVFGRKSWVRASGSYIRDQQVMEDQWDVDQKNERLLAGGNVPNVDDVAFNERRWAFRGDGEVFGPGNLRATGDIKLVSDNDHPTDFRDMREFNKDRFLESVGFVETRQDWGRPVGGYVGARWADDLQSPDDEDRDDFLLQRFTEASGRSLTDPILERTGLGLVGSMGVDYIHFRARNNPADQVGSSSVQVREEFFDTGIDALPDDREGTNRKTLEVAQDPPPGLTTTPRASYDPNNDNDQSLDRERNSTLIATFDGPPVGSNANDGSEEVCRRTIEDYNASLNPNQTAANPDACQSLTRAPEQDGSYQEGEPLVDEGHRLSFHPRIARPFDVGHFELTPEVGYRQNLYFSDRQNRSVEENGLFTARFDVTTRLSKQLAYNAEDRRGVLTHLLTPRVSWVYANPRDQSGDPVFVPKTRLSQDRIRQLETENVFDDPADRLEDFNQIIFTAGNRFYRSTGFERTWLGDVTISQAWDLDDRELGDFVIDGRTGRWKGVSSTFHLTVDPAESQVTEGLVDLRWRAPFDVTMALRYRYLEDIPFFFESYRGENSDRFDEFEEGFTRVSQIDAEMSIPLFDRLVLGGKITYSIEDDLRLRTRGSIDYVSKCRCWAAGVEIRDSRNDGIQTSFRFTILQPGSNLKNPFQQGAGPFTVQPALY